MIIKVKCYFPMGVLLMATQNLQDDGGNWENRIIAISPLSRNIGEDKSYEISGMTIEMNDSDRFFRDMMSGDNRYIAGKKVELMDQENGLIYTGNVEKWEFQEDAFLLHINDRLSGLDEVIPKTLTKEEYEDAADEADGTSVPIIYGYIHAPAGAVTCWKVEPGKYLLADHHVFDVLGVFTKDGSDVSSDFAFYNEGTGTGNERAFLYYEGQGTFVEDNIRVNVKGKMSDSVLIEHPIDALEDLFNSSEGYTGMILSSLGRDGNYAVMSNRGYKIAAVIRDQKTLKEFLAVFSYSFDCDFYLGKDNTIVISLLNWDNIQSVRTLDVNRITSFQLQELPEDIRNKVKYNYRYNYAEQKYQRVPLYEKRESIENWGEFYNKNEAVNCHFVYDENTALDVVQRYTFQRMNPRRIASVELPLMEFSGLDIADIVEIGHPAAIDEKERKYQLRRINIDFLADAVQVECVDISNLTAGIFILGDGNDMADNWSEADDSDRRYAYLCDNDGYFANDIDEGKILY